MLVFSGVMIEQKIWQNKFGGKIYANHSSNHSKGVAILFNPKLDFKINSIHKDKNGRVIIISIVLEDNTFVIANVYFILFIYKNVFSLLEPFANDQIINSWRRPKLLFIKQR